MKKYIDIIILIVLPIIAFKKVIEHTVKETIQKELKNMAVKTVIKIDDDRLIEKVTQCIEDIRLKEELHDR